LKNHTYTQEALNLWQQQKMIDVFFDANDKSSSILMRIKGRYLLGCLFVENLHLYTDFVMTYTFETWASQFNEQLEPVITILKQLHHR
jgi:hypothetical protein